MKAHTRAHTQTHTQMHTHTHAHAHTSTRTHTHPRAHTHGSNEFKLKLITSEAQANSTPSVVIRGTGGRGQMNFEYMDKTDESEEAMTFGVVMTGSVAEKYFGVYNSGLVSMRFRVETDSPNYQLGQV